VVVNPRRAAYYRALFDAFGSVRPALPGRRHVALAVDNPPLLAGSNLAAAESPLAAMAGVAIAGGTSHAVAFIAIAAGIGAGWRRRLRTRCRGGASSLPSDSSIGSSAPTRSCSTSQPI
jgi:hypothetical protein